MPRYHHHRRRSGRHADGAAARRPWRAACALIERRADPRSGRARARPLDQSGAGRARHRRRSSRPACSARIARQWSPMPGRMLHDERGALQFLRYGQRERRGASMPWPRAAQPDADGGGRRAPGDRAASSTPAASTWTAARARWQLRDERSGAARSEALRDTARRRRRRLRGARSAAGARGCQPGATSELLLHDYKELRPCPPTLRARALRVRAAGAAHLAARRLHADRAAQYRRQLHRDAVPAAPRRTELRSTAGCRRRARRSSSGSSPMPRARSPI